MARPVTLLSDATANRRKFEQLFAAGAAPAEKERRRYAEGMYIVAEVHPGAENEAELRVKVLNDDGGERGVVTWSVVKEADQWKLKSAPLP